jgi:hypothetical protein
MAFILFVSEPHAIMNKRNAAAGSLPDAGTRRREASYAGAFA